MTTRILAVLIGIAILSLQLAAQQQDSIVRMQELTPSDTAAAAPKEGFFKRNYPDPKKALFMSYVLPGSGQVYNKHWWKLPIVYGAFGGLIYAINFNTSRYNRFSTALDLKRQDEMHEFSGTRLDSENALQTLRDQYDRNRQLSWIGLVFTYALTGIDAFVSAHLKSFDVSEDISLKLKPAVETVPVSASPAIGLGLRFSLNTPPATHRPNSGY